MKYLVEFIGTFFLVFTIGMTIVDPGGAGTMAPVAIGAVLACMVYAGGHVSGAHYNPAVTLAVAIRGKCTPKDAVIYVIAQVLAAVVAAMVVLWFKGEAANIVPRDIKIAPALVGEALFTFALAYVILNVATAKGTSGNQYFGIAIALTVVAGAYAVVPVGGGALNPAVTIAALVMGLNKASDCWVHFAGQGLGAVGAALVFKAINRD